MGTSATVFPTAGQATIINEGGNIPLLIGGLTEFRNGATAGSAMIINSAATAINGFGGWTQFYDNSTAGSATITTLAGIVPEANPAKTVFNNASSAGSATITAGGNSIAAGHTETLFFDTATAGQSTLRNEAAKAPGGSPGSTIFRFASTAGSATLIAEAGVPGTAGGNILFWETSDGGTARAIISGNAGSVGVMDISFRSNAGMSIGSIEGNGVIYLGSRNLRVGTNNRTTEFGGSLRDGGITPGVGGSLSVVGTGALMLTGANTYTGGTTIGNGVTANSGKLVAGNLFGSATGSGPVTVRRGGTLSGSGFIAGPVTLQAGGAIVPGDPVTLTLEDDLIWDGGSTIQLALGPDQAGSDLLQINGSLIKGEPGDFRFELVDFGAVVGQSYDLIHFDSLQGFTASDFSFSGFGGNFTVSGGTVGVHLTGVPEVGATGLLIHGALLISSIRRRHRR
jgi:autotransporter-associated beta strand protein